MPGVRASILAELLCYDTHADAFRRKTLSLSYVQEGFLRQLHADETLTDSQRRKALPVQTLPAAFLPVWESEPAHASSLQQRIIR